MKKLLLSSFLFTGSLFAQNSVALMVGNKSAELSITHTDEMVYGIAIAGTSSKLAEKRANSVSLQDHKFLNKYTPAVFGLIGGDFESLAIIAKLGGCYINQAINGIPDSKKIYLAAGIAIDVKASELIGIRGSFDNVSGALVGVTLNL